MKKNDIMNDEEIEHIVKEKQEKLEKVKMSKANEKMMKEIRKALKHDAMIINQYLKLAVCDGKPVRVDADDGRFKLNVGTWYLIFEVPLTRSWVNIEYGSNGFFFKEIGKPCTNLKKQYMAVECLTRFLNDKSENILEEINAAVDKKINTYKNADCNVDSHYEID